MVSEVHGLNRVEEKGGTKGRRTCVRCRVWGVCGRVCGSVCGSVCGCVRVCVR